MESTNRALTARTLATLAVLSCAGLTSSLHGQQAPVTLYAAVSTLPDAPMPQGAAAQAAQGGLSGLVLDSSGAEIPMAKLILRRAVAEVQTVASAADGTFVLTNLAAGAYTLEVSAPGFQRYRSPAIELASGQMLALPAITLQISSADSEITVRPTEVIAAEQIHEEEKQRFIGIIPNFYTSYRYDAVPLTTKQKYSLSIRDTFDPVSLIGPLIAASIEQANNTYPGYGDDAGGYGKRVAANFGDGLTSDFLRHAILPQIFHQDPRYFVQGSGTKKSRFYHAISYSVISRSDKGKPMPNYSNFLGEIGSGLISNLYYPHADRGVGLVFTNATIGLASRAGTTVLREFLSGRVTSNVHSVPKAQPQP